MLSRRWLRILLVVVGGGALLLLLVLVEPDHDPLYTSGGYCVSLLERPRQLEV